MPLVIGIENGTDKGFTKKELGLTNGFTLGVICMHAGIGRIGDKGYGIVISAEEAVERFAPLDLINETDRDAIINILQKDWNNR